MKIYLLDINPTMTASWNNLFWEYKNVEVTTQYFHDFMQSHDVDCVVSPANSFGLMDGGYDLAITKWFGDQLQQRVQKHIIKDYYGEQPVGSSFIIPTTPLDSKQFLIHTPSMRTPGRIIDVQVIYWCMRSSLIMAMDNDIKSIVIPAFGGLTGRISPEIVASMMHKAYMQLLNPPEKLNWNHVQGHQI